MRVSREQFRSLVEEHQRMVFGTALRMLSDPGEAEEVAQDVFLELHDALPKLESPEHIRLWLKQVAKHRSTDAWRRRMHRPELLAAEWQEHLHPARLGPSIGNSISFRLDGMMHALPEPYRTAVMLRYTSDADPEDIAAITGNPLATSKSHLQRGLAMLRKRAAVVLKEWIR